VPDINQALANVRSGNGTLSDQATVMTGSATDLVTAAGTGFTLTPEAATALIASCDKSLDVLHGIARDLRNVRDAPNLGETKGAKAVSALTQNAAKDHQGIVAAVTGLQATITQMREAYQKAVANYQAIEMQVADSANRLTQELRSQNAPATQRGRIRAE
jgi:hypothetical protein